MIKTFRYIAIIPARGGSKRLPGKNLMPLAGKPLIAWTIEAAVNSGVFSRVIVSTDDIDIAETAVEYGAEVPFMRPPELAGDQAATAEVITHCLINLGIPDEGAYTHLACLQPTSPLRSSENIEKAAKMMEEKQADAIISVCKSEHSPLWSNTLPPDFSMQGFLQHRLQKTPSQELPEYYRLNGAMYFCDIKRFMQEQSLFLKSNIYAFVMNRKNSIDIDDEVDFDLAGIYLSRI